MIKLRNYQLDLIEAVRDQMRSGVKSVLIQSPTGSGKTALTAAMLTSAVSKGKVAWFVVHRRELIKQSAAAFQSAGAPFGIASNGFTLEPEKPIQICGVQSIVARRDKLPTPNLVVWDEAHHLAAGTWAHIRQSLPDAYHIGLTATPERLDGRGLRPFFDHMVCGPSVRSLIDDGYLADFKLFIPPSSISLDGVHTRGGDFARDELERIVDTPAIIGDAVDHYQRLASGMQAIVFCVSIPHSRNVADGFIASGIPSVHVDGETPHKERDATMADFSRGNIRILCNVDLFGEGVDVPSVGAAILLRPTQSLALHLQQVGRVLRPSPGKSHAIIIDHVGNTERHGWPDDHRWWSLDAKKRKRNAEKAMGVKCCKACFAAIPMNAITCPHCKTPIEKMVREIDELEGDLVEAERLFKIEKKREQGACRTMEELVSLGKSRGYRNPVGWAKHVLAARLVAS